MLVWRKEYRPQAGSGYKPADARRRIGRVEWREPLARVLEALPPSSITFAMKAFKRLGPLRT